MASKSSKAVVANVGYDRFVIPAQNYGGKQNGITCNNVGAKGKQSNSYERTAKATCVDKHTGAYAHSATKEVISTGGIFKERSTGRVGIKNEYSNTKICRVGDKSGYSEYQVQERFRRVDYGGNSSNKGNGSNLIKGSSGSNGKIIKKEGSSARHNSNIRVSANIKGSSNIRASSSASSSAKGSSNKASISIKGVNYH